MIQWAKNKNLCNDIIDSISTDINWVNYSSSPTWININSEMAFGQIPFIFPSRFGHEQKSPGLRFQVDISMKPSLPQVVATTAEPQIFFGCKNVNK